MVADKGGVTLTDLRRPPEDLNVPTGENLTHGARVVHTVGSDCAIGKKTMALELDLEARRRGLASVFVPTGQTGIAIAGWGIAVDAVVGSREHGKTKPHPSIFESALDLLGVGPTEAVMVGDSIEDDIEGARALGMRAVLLDRDGRHPEVEDRIESLAALPAALGLA